jgi:hypothetical protein
VREFGFVAPTGSKRFLSDLHRLLAERQERLPARVRRAIGELWEEVRELEHPNHTLESELETFAHDEPVLQALLAIAGIGLLTATALFATVANIHGDAYVHMLMIHGARSALNAAHRTEAAGKPLTELQAWALDAHVWRTATKPPSRSRTNSHASYGLSGTTNERSTAITSCAPQLDPRPQTTHSGKESSSLPLHCDETPHSWQSGRCVAGDKPITSLIFEISQREAPGARIPWWPGVWLHI